MPGPDEINTNLTTQQQLSRLQQPQAEVPKERQLDIATEMKNTAARAAEQQPPAVEEEPKSREFTFDLGAGYKEIDIPKESSLYNFGGYQASAGVSLGAGVNFKDGTYLKGTVQTGVNPIDAVHKGEHTPSGFAELEVGHDFDIGRNMGLNLNGRAQASYEANNLDKIDLRASTGAALTYKNNHGTKISAGVEAGIIKGQTDVQQVETAVYNGSITDTHGISVSTNGDVRTYNLHREDLVPGRNPQYTQQEIMSARYYDPEAGKYRDIVEVHSTVYGELTTVETSEVKRKKANTPYITPKVTVEQQLGKSNFTLTGSASLNEVNAGVRYRFGGGKNK